MENAGSLWCRNEEFDEDLMKWWLIQCLISGKKPTMSFTCYLFHSLFLFTLSSISLFSLTLSPSLSLFLLWDFSRSFRPSLEVYNHSYWLSMGFTRNICVCEYSTGRSLRGFSWHTCAKGVRLGVFISEQRQKHMCTHVHDLPFSQVEKEVGQALWPFNSKLKQRTNQKHVWAFF